MLSIESDKEHEYEQKIIQLLNQKSDYIAQIISIKEVVQENHRKYHEEGIITKAFDAKTLDNRIEIIKLKIDKINIEILIAQKNKDEFKRLEILCQQ